MSTRNVWLTLTIRPSGVVVRYPHGRPIVEPLGIIVGQRAEKRVRAPPLGSRHPSALGVDEVGDGGGGRIRSAQVGAVAGGVEEHKPAVGNGVGHVLANRHRGDHILAALQHQRRYCHLGQIGPIVGKERHPSELAGDLRVGPTEALGQLLAQFRTIRRCP